jgi:hypothetical protein
MNVECFQNREMQLTFREGAKVKNVFHFEVQEFCKLFILQFLFKIFPWGVHIQITFLSYLKIDVYYNISFSDHMIFTLTLMTDICVWKKHPTLCN